MNEPGLLLTVKQAEELFQQLSHEQVIEMLREYRFVRNAVCERTLGVPTGTANWPHRALRRAKHMRDCEQVLRQVMGNMEAAIITGKAQLREMDCSNCCGTGSTSLGSRCSICGGNGWRHYDQ